VTNEQNLSMLHAEVDGRGPRLVLVHGFAQNRNCWGPIAADLARDHEVVRVDAPGHGRSAQFHAGLRTGARLIADQGGRATYLGYSMGARFVLHLALANPELVERLVRQRNDGAAAARLEREGLEPFLEAWLAQPLFAGLSEDMQFRAARRENTVEGLAESLRQAGTGSQDPLWDRLGRIEVPTLVVAGADDTKFSAEGSHIVESIGANATLALIPNAGHAAHLEQPVTFLSTLRAWLSG